MHSQAARPTKIAPRTTNTAHCSSDVHATKTFPLTAENNSNNDDISPGINGTSYNLVTVEQDFKLAGWQGSLAAAGSNHARYRVMTLGMASTPNDDHRVS